ncbi:AMP-binding enzyme, partial [Stigmatella aurantiaca]|uniref:AMP-binding enzyme n=1 Tax=Stigmatella aurantiaca TaxID=41 RepID=UPI003B2858D5
MEGFGPGVAVNRGSGGDQGNADRCDHATRTHGPSRFVPSTGIRHPRPPPPFRKTVPDERWGESVKAFVVLKPDQKATEEDILDVARKHLASYQKPRSVEFMPS